MNYVVLNGKRSTLVKGLLISSLPPISKPLMRTNIEEIDGRDGDIVTKLGYAAYNKVMTIGLAGDYDVDRVIEYFDSDGEVIFSNEPDKFYRYKILEQIDFERLLRFKTAEVTFHVQPFKYSAVDEVKKPKEYFFPAQYNQRIYSFGSIVYDGARYVFDINGTAPSTISLSLPCKEFTLKQSEEYKMIVAPKGTGFSACTASLAGHSLTMSGLNVTSFQQLADVTTDELTIEIPSETAISGTLEVHIFKNTYSSETHTESLSLTSQGNCTARPKVIVRGTGNVTLKINDETVVTLDLTSYDEAGITLDSESLNAYGYDGMKNRLVTGDLRDLRLSPGRKVFAWSATNGSVAGVEIQNYSRWI